MYPKEPIETDSYLERQKSTSFVGTSRPVGNACKSPDEEQGTEISVQCVWSPFRDGQGTLADTACLVTHFSSLIWI